MDIILLRRTFGAGASKASFVGLLQWLDPPQHVHKLVYIIVDDAVGGLIPVVRRRICAQRRIVVTRHNVGVEAERVRETGAPAEATRVVASF
jgi:hypothetical protein